MKWDEEIQKEWGDLRRPKGTLRDKSKARKYVVWKVPCVGMYKMNFDGPAKGNPGPIGAGCIIRDCRGNCNWVAMEDWPRYK